VESDAVTAAVAGAHQRDVCGRERQKPLTAAGALRIVFEQKMIAIVAQGMGINILLLKK
jgi:hypothetical protein